jgi:hypothetical protein
MSVIGKGSWLSATISRSVLKAVLFNGIGRGPFLFDATAYNKPFCQSIASGEIAISCPRRKGEFTAKITNRKSNVSGWVANVCHSFSFCSPVSDRRRGSASFSFLTHRIGLSFINPCSHAKVNILDRVDISRFTDAADL